MSAVAANVAPIFILILIGWLTVKAGLFRADAGEILSDFVFKIAVPTLIFRTLAEANFHGASPFRLWLTYFMRRGRNLDGWAYRHAVHLQAG